MAASIQFHAAIVTQVSYMSVNLFLCAIICIMYHCVLAHKRPCGVLISLLVLSPIVGPDTFMVKVFVFFYRKNMQASNLS